MDSLTQIVLGAAVGEATLGHKIGRKAAFYGGVLGTLPDLDVLWVKNAVDNFTEHRSFSHSIFILLALSPLIAWVLQRFHPFHTVGINIGTEERQRIRFSYYLFAVSLCLVTHPLLDVFTIYGTQLLWPLTQYPFGLGSIFIVDPMYTIPFLIGLLITVWTRNREPLFWMIIISTAYLVWSLIAQNIQANKFERSLVTQGIKSHQQLTLPTPLNTLLWKNIAMTDHGYWVSFGSVFDSSKKEIVSKFFPSENFLLTSIGNEYEVKKLHYFTKGFFQIKQVQEDVIFSDLRMGGFGQFVFNFKIATIFPDGQLHIADEAEHFSLRPTDSSVKTRLSVLWKRIWNSNVDLFNYFE